MKPYFSKLLTEKERAGSKNKSAKTHLKITKYDPDKDYDYPSRLGMSRRSAINHGSLGGKELTDVLSPLRGYLRKSVGRPWNDVYSELCKNLDRRSVSGNHVFQHLWDYVTDNCWIGAETGNIYADTDHGTHELFTSQYWRRKEYYVHPLTGLLCEVPVKEIPDNRNKVTVKEEIPIEPGKEYRLIDGIWYYTEFTLVTMFVEKANSFYLGKFRGYRPEVEKVIQVKRQLNKKELQSLSLTNTLNV